jgi:nucleotide-binding universal stress UspA family protein
MLTQHADPARAILQYAETHQIDLISIGTHGDNLAHRYLSRGGSLDLLGQTAGKVVRHAAVPVLTVIQRLARAPDSIRSILVPIDFSPLSLLALSQARDLAALYEARLDVLHVMTNGAPRTNGHDPIEARRADLVAAFDEAPGATVGVDFHVATGIPHREIQGAIEQRSPDMLVIGAYAEEGQDLLGDVAARVVRSSPCAVLTVRGEPLSLRTAADPPIPSTRIQPSTFQGKRAVS